MKLYRHLLVLATSLVALSSPLTAQTLKIFVLAGQSNMEGQAWTYDDPAFGKFNVPTLEFLVSGTPEATTYLANMPFGFKDSLAPSWMNPRTDAWCVHYDSSNGNAKTVQPAFEATSRFTGIGPLSPGFGVATNNGSMLGPELGMGIRIADATTDPVFLFKSDKGGTTLAEDWRPPSAVAARGGSVGSNFTNTINRFAEFLDTLDADLADDGILNAYGNATGYEICTLFWFQGFNEKVENGGAFKPEYQANLIDLINDVRAADARIPADLPYLIIESSDQDADLNNSRINAVAAINAGIPGTAAFFESENMIDNNPGPVNWGNNKDGNPFMTFWGFHYHTRAENYLEIGWIAGGAVLDNNWLDTSDFWVDRPSATSVAFNQADISTAVNEAADTVTVYWGTSDPGPTATCWDQSVSLGAQAAGAITTTLTGLVEDTTYFYRVNATNTAQGADVWSAPNSLTTPLEFPIPEMGIPVTGLVLSDSASVESTLSVADGDVTLVWAQSDQGATTIAAWTSAPGGGSQAFPSSQMDTVISHTITGLTANTGYSYRFYASNALGDNWSAAGSFTTPATGTFVWLSGILNDLNNTNYSTGTSPFNGVANVVQITGGGMVKNTNVYNLEGVDTYNVFNGGVIQNNKAGNKNINGNGATVNVSDGGTLAPGNWFKDLTVNLSGSGVLLVSNAGDTLLPSVSGVNLDSGWTGEVYITAQENLDEVSEFLSWMGTRFNVDGVALTSADLGTKFTVEVVASGSGNEPAFATKDSGLSMKLIGSSGGTPFTSWAGGFSSLGDSNPSLDFDGGGLATGIEWVVGGDPANGRDDAGNAPTLDDSDPTYLIFTFKRRDAAAADAGTDIRVQYGTDLSSWRNSTDHGVADGVIIDDSTDLGDGFHQVAVSIPRNLEIDGKLFARLSVAMR